MKTTVNDSRTIFHFSRPELTSMLAHMSRDATRPNICALVLDPDGGRAMATDGHRAVILATGDRVEHDRAAKHGKFVLVARGSLERILKGSRAKDVVEVELRATDALLRCGTNAEMVDFVDATPSPIDRVVPRVGPAHTHQGVAQGFNAAYLVDLAEVAKACPPLLVERYRGKTERRPVHPVLYPGASALDPMVAVLECPANQCTWTICVMPVAM